LKKGREKGTSSLLGRGTDRKRRGTLTMQKGGGEMKKGNVVILGGGGGGGEGIMLQ